MNRARKLFWFLAGFCGASAVAFAHRGDTFSVVLQLVGVASWVGLALLPNVFFLVDRDGER
jgi:hypothetical protein